MSNSTKPFICSYEGCKSAFNRPYKLKNHMTLHTNSRPFICSYDDCDKSYSQPQHLKRHEDTHEGNFKCTEESCHQIFISKYNLTKHVNNIHLKKKPKTYKCSYCDQDFSKHCWLKRHESKHTGIKPYVCMYDGCEKRFIVPSKLHRHLKVHEGYTCIKPNCNEHFAKWTLYLKHLKVAHPIYHKCEICEKQFYNFHNLQAHSVVHQSEREVFECSEPNCSRFYLVKRNLVHHIKSYHEKRLFICSEKDCHKAFKTEAEMSRHFLNQHDPNKRLRKRKKKRKPKPTFTEKLAGFTNKKQKGNKIETEVLMQVSEECLNTEMKDQNEITTMCDEEETFEVDDEIQNLLNMIEERGANKTVDKIEYVSFKEFIKLKKDL